MPSTAQAPTDRTKGLDHAEARSRALRYGPNAIEQAATAWWLQLLGKLWGPVPWMLEAVIVLQLLLGREQEAVVIGFLLGFNAVVAYVQERRAGDALALLRRRLQVNARVLRDGVWSRVPAAQLVPGDIVHVRAGDIVPADLDLFDGGVALDQSALTGESLAVDAAPGQPAYTGSIVRQGEASGEVTAIGARTYFGRTAELVRASSAPSHMQRTIFAIVQRLVAFDLLLVLLVIVYALRHALPLGDTLVFALMLLVASVPVALPATYTLATAVAASRLAHRGVLVTRLPAVEEAAAMDTLLSDKTGTLTLNALSLEACKALDGVAPSEVLRVAALASDAATQDPLDLAVLEAWQARERGAPGAEPAPAAQPVPARREFHPFDPATRLSEGVYQDDGRAWHALKGASEAVLARCGADAAQRALAVQAEQELAAAGARVLAVAAGPADKPRLLGFVGLSDPPRPDAAQLIARLRELGVRVSMATGDALQTARAVGTRIGLGGQACTADAERLRHPEDCDIFARVLPQDKHAIVRALQRDGHVTGMTGDGVNDAPALRQAELGIAVASATDVAKAAAGVVLTDAGLSGVLTVVEAGREVHRRMLTYVINKVVKTLEIVVFLTAGLWLTGGFVISARLIVLLLFANDFVTMSIAVDRVRPAARPQRWRVGQLVGAASLLALVSLLFSMSVYLWARARFGLDAAQMQTLVFLLLVFTTQANVYVLRDDGRIGAFAPGRALAAASVADLLLVTALAASATLMAGLPLSVIGRLLLLVAAFALLLDQAKGLVFARFGLR
ncbi:plasma-membrane proton-efflux P-type ATPase [Thiomonas sp.]|uniref:plasma-membrane proton-efflux P-type ATPase n=1 Tax=Thiomonas sp. TaxID=2047785 RepID=UPI00263A261D|nr:plasma-membrane proton-efflux P-type ATPase [Thiomonas sp.]